MPEKFEKRRVAYSAEQMFDLVSDVESYPEFLPWCIYAAVAKRSKSGMEAKLTVGKGAFRESFVSKVALDRPRRISVCFGGGKILSRLRNEWNFEAADDGCELSFYVDFGFESQIFGAMVELFFDKAFGRMAEAFEKRAKEIYGRKPR